MKLVITIDTEEDNWGDFNSSGYTLENIKRVPSLQDLFNEFGVSPTYLITYPVATDKISISILRRIFEAGKCEIGMHCHPWNTPPFEEETSHSNTMLANLPAVLQYKKMSTLHAVIKENFGFEPNIFRAGRWSCNENVLENLCRLGYRIDTSMTAFMSWTRYQGSDYSCIFPHPFRLSCASEYRSSSNGDLIEVPVTAGFLQRNFNLCKFISGVIDRELFNRLRVRGILSRLNLLNKVCLSPELASSDDMIKLTKVMMNNNHKILNMTFHTTTLMAGLGPFVRTEEDQIQFIQRIKEFFVFVRSVGIEHTKLSDITNSI